MTTMTRLLARQDELVIRELDDELLVYDSRADVAHSIGKLPAWVLGACEQETTLADLVAMVPEDRLPEALDREDAVRQAVGELLDKDLLTGIGGSNLTRRDAVRRMAGVGAAAFAGPMIVSAAVKPAYALAYGTCVGNHQPCVPGGAPCCKTGTSTLVCTNGLPSQSKSKDQTYCAAPSCVPKGSKPPGSNGKDTNCSSATASACCSGVCSGNFCG
jgi:hypothetical protein